MYPSLSVSYVSYCVFPLRAFNIAKRLKGEEVGPEVTEERRRY
jgi:hypothetical protein